MDFSRRHVLEEGVATRSNIRFIPEEENNDETNGNGNSKTLDGKVVEAANRAAQELLLGSYSSSTQEDPPDPSRIDASLYPERMTPQSETIQPNDLVVIFESFDNLNFVYATPNAIFNNRNGHFHHDDFLGQPFGCKVRSRNNRGYGFCYLLKPTPELWARSLNHRTQIVHELDASMIVFYLHLRPNMVVCESGTGSGALSHTILRTIAPQGKLHTFEFNQRRAEQARQEFAKHGISHLVEVYHKDVCGKQQNTAASTENNGKNQEAGESVQSTPQEPCSKGGFGLEGQSVHAIILDLPEPWLAIPHAAFCLKPNGRIASYSPCVEQTQRTVAAMRQAGFHSLKTMEFRMRENYVDEVEYEPPPKEKRPRVEPNTNQRCLLSEFAARAMEEDNDTYMSAGDDTGAEADNEKSEISETEADHLDEAALATVDAVPTLPAAAGITSASKDVSANNNSNTKSSTGTGVDASTTTKRGTRKMLVARPFVMMRGHTAFLTFATAGNVAQPDPDQNSGGSGNDGNS